MEPQEAAQHTAVTYFAQTDARGKRVPFGIKEEDRARHMYVIGKTGMGKSTMLENMAIQDIQSGRGITFIDPHGSSAEKLLDYVPEARIRDVLYCAPVDRSYPISFNVMEKVDPDKRFLVVNGLMSTFEKIWQDAWSARMAYILQNTLGALLEWPGATLLAVNRMYVDKEFRKRVVDNTTDPSVKAFWTEEFTKYTDRFAAEATPAIQNKIGQFASNALVRNIIGQPHSAFDLRTIMDGKKIFIVNLSKGRVGEGNANLLGSMIITKLYLAAMSRADAPPSVLRTLPPHYVYVDEFQSFANRSFADILSEARKYKLALTIAHQYIEQMDEEVRAAVFGNVGTLVTFRVGAYDAEVLEKEFAPTFTVTDIVNLGARQIYLKLMIDGVASQPFSATTLPPIELPRISYRDMVVAHSRRTYARPRAEVEREINEWHESFRNAAAPKPPTSRTDKVSADAAPAKGNTPPASKRESPDAPRPRAAAPAASASSLQKKGEGAVGAQEKSLKEVLAEIAGKAAAAQRAAAQDAPAPPGEGAAEREKGARPKGVAAAASREREALREVLAALTRKGEHARAGAPTPDSALSAAPSSVPAAGTKDGKEGNEEPTATAPAPPAGVSVEQLKNILDVSDELRKP